MARPDSIVGKILEGNQRETIASSTVFKGEGGPRFTPNDLPRGTDLRTTILNDALAGKNIPWQDMPKKVLAEKARTTLRDEYLKKIGVDINDISEDKDGQTNKDKFRDLLAGKWTATKFKKLEKEFENAPKMDETNAFFYRGHNGNDRT